MTAFLRRVMTGAASDEQAKDTGMAIVLLLLLVAMARPAGYYLLGALVVHVINMIAPQVFRPAAVVWFGVAQIMGAVMSRVILVIVFYGVVTPIAIIRRILGRDGLMLDGFKRGTGSVMRTRDYTFVGKDLERPY